MFDRHDRPENTERDFQRADAERDTVEVASEKRERRLDHVPLFLLPAIVEVANRPEFGGFSEDDPNPSLKSYDVGGCNDPNCKVCSND